MCLFLFWRSMRLDRRQQVLTVFHLDFWIIPRWWKIPYRDVRDVLYKYKDYGFARNVYFARSSLDCYTVALELTNFHQVDLFWWYGEGEFQNETLLPDWMYWKQFAFDTKGSQKRESLQFFEMLRHELMASRNPEHQELPRAGRLRG
ncbi:MAG: hypothetical protein JJU11_01200 [Candidatus Sumerlaeia bacterium]|nr:hypothetical protein [Candidatus Sumerlaeia bacterium]